MKRKTRDTEGVTKFIRRYQKTSPLPFRQLHGLNTWRRILYQLKMIGQDPKRYRGIGFGNLSQRLPPFQALPHRRRFAITGTQTGRLATLNERHYSVVLESDPQNNLIVAEGPVPPSAEALTHGMLYALDNRLRTILHVHCPVIWKKAKQLKIPLTRRRAAYGTPAMAAEVRRLFKNPTVRKKGIFGMGGHRDGIVSFGRNLEETGFLLINYFIHAFQK
ncbi:MAG: class II aldolase/adducin family protein [Elusimicrobia bacterium]|nr:class II aldolase/adducin family protein [Candidatus Obscuribacterium magneticum]